MNRKEMEVVLKTIWMLMELLLPYINSPDRDDWSNAIGIVETTVFETDEEENDESHSQRSEA